MGGGGGGGCQNGRRVGGGQCSLAGCTLDGSYPTGYSKDQKRSFRRKAKLNFRVKSGVLIMHATSVSAEERRWRRVTTAEEERTVYVGAGGYSRKIH